ncbi:hypothetical protein PACTADRAFT_1462 [Pachysolen tannophilus NRRL Y-2460]|uniref:Uncharacterized protein n=1 Tax=Pachysolen tannophilus NRRL Y-2460 TaxID=669874 RepID=A0A1E4TYQ0_PACTA|nr:hypothetical protein PACTADRAFT_1462 [Pachysolen tannophilus NRRL Y-2460]
MSDSNSRSESALPDLQVSGNDKNQSVRLKQGGPAIFVTPNNNSLSSSIPNLRPPTRRDGEEGDENDFDENGTDYDDEFFINEEDETEITQDQHLNLYRVTSPTFSIASSMHGNNNNNNNNNNDEINNSNRNSRSKYNNASMFPRSSSPESRRYSLLVPNLANSLYNHNNNSSTNSLTSNSSTSNNASNASNNKHTKRHSLNYFPQALPPPRSRSPIRSRSPVRSKSPVRSNSNTYNPFNFKSTSLMTHGNGSNNSLAPVSIGMGVVGSPKAQYRRGHRYKHSSVSMNLFQEPPKRQPLNVPESFPIPTFKEIINSLDNVQKLKLTWSFLHLLFVIIVFILGINYNNILLSTLSHLIFYDLIGNFIIVIVNIMTNFDCWNNSSLKYPFGLGRIEVLIGFALSVSLIFVGVDLLSHLIEEFVIKLIMGDAKDEHLLEEENIYSSTHSHQHTGDGKNLSILTFELLITLTISITMLSSQFILDKSGLKSINKVKTKNSIFNLILNRKNYLISNSTSFLTVFFAIYSAIYYPILIHNSNAEVFNDFSILFTALLIVYIGYKLIKHLSYILLISYPYHNGSENGNTTKLNKVVTLLFNKIENLEFFKKTYNIEDIIISKVNYKIYIIIVSLNMFGCTDDDESRMIFSINRLIAETMNEEENNIDADPSSLEIEKTQTKLDRNDIPSNGNRYEITVDINRAGIR